MGMDNAIFHMHYGARTVKHVEESSRRTVNFETPSQNLPVVFEEKYKISQLK
jgi:hypothetical protein